MSEISLRPIREDDLGEFERVFFDPEGTGPFQWFGHRSPHGQRELFAKHGFLTADSGSLSITFGEQLAGRVDWFASYWGRPDTSQCWTIAIGVFPDLRSRGIGTRAQALLAEYLFQHTRAVRIQAYTDVDNMAEQKALVGAGFIREGILRAAQFRGGRFHDQEIYSLVRPAPRTV